MGVNAVTSKDPYEFLKRPIHQVNGQEQQPPKVTQQPKVDEQQPYALGQLGGITVAPRVNGVEGVVRTQHIGMVQGEDGMTPISMGSQGVGFGTVMADGAGEHYDNGLGHSKHTKWWAA